MLGSPPPLPPPLMAQGPGATARSWEDQIPSPGPIVVSWLKIGLQATRPQDELAIVEGRGASTSVRVTLVGSPPRLAVKSSLPAWEGWFPAALDAEEFIDSRAPPPLPPRLP